MPLVPSEYNPPFYLRNGHISTLLPGLFRKVSDVNYQRERIFTADDDFLDLDWSRPGSRRLVILSHGLEGNSQRSYMLGMVRYMNEMGWDALSWNCRSCSGEMNRLPRFYHHADSSDLAEVISHVVTNYSYEEIFLTGFSMGGNMILKYLGESGREVPSIICGAAVYSVPVDLKSSVDALGLSQNRIYRRRFLKKLKWKIQQKAELFPEHIDSSNWDEITHFPDFDNRYTAPLHGFSNAEDFYNQASPIRYLEQINIPTLLVNALNDPFLGAGCYPLESCRTLTKVFLETPEFGGHVGFSLSGPVNFMEQRTHQFYEEIKNI